MDKKLLSSFPSIVNTSIHYGKLIRLDRLGEWNFVIMPNQIRRRVISSFSPSGAIGQIQSQIFRNQTEELIIPSLNLEVKKYNKSLSDYLDSLVALSRPYPGLSSPLVLKFAWGQEIFTPCIIKELSILSNDWYSDGQVSRATVSLTLLRVPYDQVVNVAPS
ncbi:hypothetical protein [Moorena sp. SIO3A2]|uniref:hypothetical protein n=1 Tax=Moorena sp. SIO3A2 TaxID=2607841 RepID=UPI0013B72E46|nr:hypothetical protein [Moorena sp. SIO3A2]NER90366.1 hypothetical protein [Moorena sp. SIO3A2]